MDVSQLIQQTLTEVGLDSGTLLLPTGTLAGLPDLQRRQELKKKIAMDRSLKRILIGLLVVQAIVGYFLLHYGS